VNRDLRKKQEGMVLQKLGEKDMAELIPAVQVFLFSRSF
jgi:hypothetical protein